MQLGFAKAHDKITRRRKGRHGPGLKNLPKIWGFLSIFTQRPKLATSNLVYGLGLPRPIIKSHPLKSGHGLGLGELPKILWFNFNIYIMAEARDFKFDTQLGFAKARHKTTSREKVGVAWG